MNCVVRKPTWFSNRSDTNQPVQYIRRLEAQNYGLKKKTISVAKTKVLICCAPTAQLICASVFTYEYCWFSPAAAHILLNVKIYLKCQNRLVSSRDKFRTNDVVSKTLLLCHFRTPKKAKSDIFINDILVYKLCYLCLKIYLDFFQCAGQGLAKPSLG